MRWKHSKLLENFAIHNQKNGIDDVRALAIDLDKLELFDTELFLESLALHGQQIIDRYKQLQFGEDIENGPLDITKLVGKL